MPMLAKKSTISPTKREKTLIEHHFDDPVLQAEFDDLTNNDDRLDYIELIRGIQQVKESGAISVDELEAILRAR
jgi:hypothetical protein